MFSFFCIESSLDLPCAKGKKINRFQLEVLNAVIFPFFFFFLLFIKIPCSSSLSSTRLKSSSFSISMRTLCLWRRVSSRSSSSNLSNVLSDRYLGGPSPPLRLRHSRCCEEDGCENAVSSSCLDSLGGLGIISVCRCRSSGPSSINGCFP